MEKRLNKAGEKVSWDFNNLYSEEDQCGCSMGFVCQMCSHKGNPKNLEKNSDYWEPIPEDSVSADIEKFIIMTNEKYDINIKIIHVNYIEIHNQGSAPSMNLQFAEFTSVKLS